MPRRCAEASFDAEVTGMTGRHAAHRVLNAGTTQRDGAGDETVGRRFVKAVAKRDFPGMASCFAADARFRALVPSGLREASGTDDPVRYLQGWFGSADRVELLDSTVAAIADRHHLAWRLRIHDATGTRLVEQQAYATVRDDRIAEMDLLCSGFRRESPAGKAVGPQGRTPEFEVAARLDGGDASCATLTPLVKASLRDLTSGQVLEIVSSEPTAGVDLASWSALTGNPVIATRAEGERNRFYVRKK